MVVRLSEGRYLEILSSVPVLDTGIEVDLYSGADPATMLATLEGAAGKAFMRELNETGGGKWTLWSHDPKATPAILAEGNLARFRVGGIDRQAVWIEERSQRVVAKGEEGDEQWAFDCRGALAGLDRASVYPSVWPVAAAAFVASSSVDNGSGSTSLAVPKPAGTAAGDVVVLSIACIGAAPATPPGWQRIRNLTESSLRLLVFRRRAVAGEPSSWTFHWSASTAATGGALTLRNATADDTAWAVNDATGSGTSVQEPSVSVGLVDGIGLGIAASASSTAITPPAGLTETVDRDGTGRRLEIAYTVNPTLGETGDLTATAGTAGWIGMQLWIPSTASNDVVFEGATFGAVLATLIDAAKLRGLLPWLTYDFTADVDSHGEPWPDVHDLSFHVGTSLLEVWRHLVTLGLEGWMTPGLRLQAFVDASRHLEDTVILRKGHHLAGDVVDTSHGIGRKSRILVEGAGGRIVEVVDPILEADAHIGRREGFLEVSTSDNPTTLQRAGEIALEVSALDDKARAVSVHHGPASEGQYEPFVDYRESDWIGLDAAGSGGVATPQRVWTIGLDEADAGNYGVELELNSPEMDRETRLYRRLNSLTRDTTAAGSGGAGGGGGVTASGKVGVNATDTPGWLGDKLTVDATLVRSITGDTGSQRVRLGVAPGGTHPDLATHDALGLATDAELATHAAAADPHPGYTTAAELAAHGHAHGDLTGVTADQHHARQHAATSASDHTFPGGTTDFLRADGSFAAPASGGMTNPMTAAADLIVGDTGGTPARLAKGSDSQVLTIDPTTHLIVWATPAASSGDVATDTIWDAKGDLAGGTGPNTAARLPVGTNGQVLTADSAETTGMKWAAAGGGGLSDYVSGAAGSGQIIIPGIAGSPDQVPASPSTYDDEFDGSLAAWTVLGSLDVSNVSDFASHWHVRKATVGLQIHGIYKAAPSLPYAVVAKISDYTAIRAGNYTEYGLALGDATPTAWCSFSFSTFNNSLQRDTWTNNTTRASTANGSTGDLQSLPPYLMVVVNSATSVDCYWSQLGLTWKKVFAGVNPGFTPVQIAVVISANGVTAEAAIDYVRFHAGSPAQSFDPATRTWA